jgi:HAD superfamily hydrolase (TIGR01484 family)
MASPEIAGTRQYDLLVVDLDGTLLDRRGRVSPRNAGAIAAAHDAGLEVIVATGRAAVECLDVLRRIGRPGAVIAAGGAMLSDAATGRTLDRSAMPRELVASITSSLNRHGHVAHLLKDPDAADYDYLIVGDGELDPATEWWFRTLPVRVRFAPTLDDDPNPADTVRVATVAVGVQLEKVANELRDDLGDRVFLQHWSAVTASEAIGSRTHLLECFNPDVNKWTATEAYCRRQGINPLRVAAIGDGLNDLALLRGAGLGIAMGNADAAILLVAQRVTADHNSDGVAHAFERILAGVW